MSEPIEATKHFLFASDFDQTLSLHDSGRVLAELLGVSDFDRKVAGLAESNLVQQGGELAYLIRHDRHSGPSGASISPRRAGACACAAIFLSSSTS